MHFTDRCVGKTRILWFWNETAFRDMNGQPSLTMSLSVVCSALACLLVSLTKLTDVQVSSHAWMWYNNWRALCDFPVGSPPPPDFWCLRRFSDHNNAELLPAAKASVFFSLALICIAHTDMFIWNKEKRLSLTLEPWEVVSFYSNYK